MSLDVRSVPVQDLRRRASATLDFRSFRAREPEGIPLWHVYDVDVGWKRSHLAMEHDMKNLELGIDRLHRAIAGLQGDDGLAELLKIIHRPGWTTPAEYKLVGGLVEIMETHVKALVTMRELLLGASREVGVH